ncbi:MAG: hypothetical protein JRI68_25965 [Deltaproteobacteria bacterium]|nr:hypothetical protein [Deltaproteobacteria bacterium]
MVRQRPDGMAGSRNHPRFALYDDGLVIFTRRASGHHLDRQAQLTAAEAQALAGRLATKAFAKLPHRIAERGPFDYESVEIVMRYSDRWKRVIAPRGPNLPRAFSTTLDQLEAFDHTPSEPWRPERILAMFSAASRDAPQVAWPADLPSPRVGINVTKGFGSLALDARHEPTVIGLIGTGKNVLVDSRAYRLSYTRELPELPVINAVRRAFIRWEADRD